MNIACLGWGSLIWNPSGLPVGEWKQDGPFLPVEFARQSKNGRLTLVLLHEGEPLPMLHATLNVHELKTAISALATREDCAERRIGYWASSGDEDQFPHAKTIGSWARDQGLDAVVWTALPARFSGIDGRVPSPVEAVSYLAALEGDKRRVAEEYVRRAPAQVRTSYRKLFEQELGWHPS